MREQCRRKRQKNKNKKKRDRDDEAFYKYNSGENNDEHL